MDNNNNNFNMIDNNNSMKSTEPASSDSYENSVGNMEEMEIIRTYGSEAKKVETGSNTEYNSTTAGSVPENNTAVGSEAGTNEYRNNGDSLRTPAYYTESYQKPEKRKNSSVMQLIAVALISSILGGTVVAGFFQFATPAIQPFANKLFSQKNSSGTAAGQDTYKRVEIVQNGDSPVTAIAEKVSPSIVGIRVTAKSTTPDFGFFFGGGSQNSTAEGSGIIIKSGGYIMTNNHVIENAYNANTGNLVNGAKIEVILPSQKDKPLSATVVGRDIRTDLAVLKVDASGLPAAELGNSDDLKIGELAVAIGNPGGLEYMGSVTVGVISGLNRTLPVVDGKEIKLIQTDAAINPGNSGGALVNSKGQVIGINTAKMAAQGFEGLGFAIPVNKAKEITDSLMQYKYVKGRPFVGISAEPRFDETFAKRNNVPVGVLVADVTPLSGAYTAGIQKNDIITKFDGQPVKNVDELNNIKNNHKPGDTVPVEIYRDGSYKTLQVKLGESKE